jgi:acetylornithine/N-succinyldiaminopimelate aminotransferase
VLKSILEDGWLKHCEKTGAYFKERLLELQNKHDMIKEVRGLGLIVGVELDQPGAPIVKTCMEKGFLINCAQEKVLRFIPPLIVTKEEIDSLITALDQVMGEAE